MSRSLCFQLASGDMLVICPGKVRHQLVHRPDLAQAEDVDKSIAKLKETANALEGARRYVEAAQ